MLCVRRWSDTEPARRLKCQLVQCREPKTGQQKVQLDDDDPLGHSSYIIYLWLYVTQLQLIGAKISSGNYQGNNS